MFAHRFLWGLALAASLAICAAASLRAGDAPAEKAAKGKLRLNREPAAKAAAKAAAETPKPEAAEEQDGEKKEEAPERFVVPEGGVKELLAFMQETMKFRPTSVEEFRELRTKGYEAVQQAAEKIKEIATDEDKQLEGYADVDGLLLYFRAQNARQDTPAERGKLTEDLKQYFADTPAPSRYGVAAAQQLATTLEYSEDPKQAIPVYQALGAALASSSDPATAKTGLKMEGAARRLDLVGKPLEISGTEFDGGTFDWDSLRGKVVLVDFWATWCGPCRAELPNVKENYARYHDKGFEVVGISLDGDRAALEAFLADEQNPWITLHDGDWNDNEVATHYGIMGIPTVILVDREGKVVSTRARGPELGKLLAELLGPVEPEAAEEKTSDKDDAAKTN